MADLAGNNRITHWMMRQEARPCRDPDVTGTARRTIPRTCQPSPSNQSYFLPMLRTCCLLLSCWAASACSLHSNSSCSTWRRSWTLVASRAEYRVTSSSALRCNPCRRTRHGTPEENAGKDTEKKTHNKLNHSIVFTPSGKHRQGVMVWRRGKHKTQNQGSSSFCSRSFLFFFSF